MRLGWAWFAPSAHILETALTSLLPQVTMRSPSSSMMSTSQTAPLWCLWLLSQTMLADSPSPASRSVPGWDLRHGVGGFEEGRPLLTYQLSSDLGR